MSTKSLLRLAQVLERRGRSRSQLYREIGKGIMTPPVRIGTNISAWPDSEIAELNSADIAGASQDDLRNLVKKLIERRTQTSPAAVQAA